MYFIFILTLFILKQSIETNSLIVNNEMASGISKQTQWQPSTGKYDYIQQLLNDNSSEIMVNWISFKKRFIWQCTILFVVLLIVTILCFYPGLLITIKFIIIL